MADASIVPIAWDAERIAAMLPSVHASPWPLDGPKDALSGALLFDFTHGGAHALLAVRPVRLTHGTRLDVVGLVSDGDRLSAAAIDAAAVRIAREYGAQALAMCTVRGHLVKACARNGWNITGMVMAKELNNVQ